MLIWRFDAPRPSISSGPLGGGIGPRLWTINASVPLGYDRDDPDVHLTDLAAQLDLTGPGVGLLTGVDVREVVKAHDEGATIWATVGIGSPAWAAAPDVCMRAFPPSQNQVQPSHEPSAQAVEVSGNAPKVGTINIVATVPVELGHAALVNAVATITEAKSQAIWDAGLEATGTATDSVTIHGTSSAGVEAYGGPRSVWGARLARATHEAVLNGARVWLSSSRSWSDKAGVPDPELPSHTIDGQT